MFERLMARAARQAAARRARAIARLAERAGEDMPPGIHVEAGEEGVVLSGPGLRWRWLNDARLRSIGLFLRGEGG